ncbi:HD domain-containing protein [bacterium]|nr:HD domain-containing protein [bacterium]MBU1638247.1 HD domain-containing protein [bacterium]MBU1920923.1 HD domain-containing protein [bacterium]
MSTPQHVRGASTPEVPLLFDLLIVDDDCDLLEMLEEYFSDAGFVLRSAASIREAKDILEKCSFRTILTDQNLRDGTGVEFLLGLKHGGVESIPLLMTGDNGREIAVDAINLGGIFKFFVKPFSMKEVRHGVEAAIVRFGAEQARRLYAREVEARNDELNAAVRRKLQNLGDTDPLQKKQIVSVVEDSNASKEWAVTQIQKAYLQTVASLTRAIEAKDFYTHGHSERVYYYCSLIAEMLDLPESSRNDLRFASILHDIGKIGIPDSVLLKKGRLTNSERGIIAEHPVLSESIISPLPFLDKVRRIVRSHHEHYDGNGYPDGLKGNEIPIEARILAVADAFDAMRSDRPYRKAMSLETAQARLVMAEGTQFCPLCVRAFLHTLQQKGESGNSGANDLFSLWSDGAFIEVEPRLE